MSFFYRDLSYPYLLETTLLLADAFEDERTASMSRKDGEKMGHSEKKEIKASLGGYNKAQTFCVRKKRTRSSKRCAETKERQGY